MNAKKNIILGLIIGLLGISLVSGGTYAYFSNTKHTDNKIVAGIMELDINDNQGILFEFENMQPGEEFSYSFHMMNTGSLNMKDIELYSESIIKDREGKVVNNGFENQILITGIKINGDSIFNGNKTLQELKTTPINLVDIFEVDEQKIQVIVYFQLDLDESQVEFQGNTMELKWTFQATQEDS